MQISYETFMENCLYGGSGADAPQLLDTAPISGSTLAQASPVLLDRLLQAQSTFSDSLVRYIEL